MVIKNKKKFIRAILLIIGITIGTIIIMTNKSFSSQEISYKTIAITSGDTLWNIAEEEQKTNSYYKNNDIRDIIRDIKTINNLNNSSLEVAQTLEIPIY